MYIERVCLRKRETGRSRSGEVIYLSLGAKVCGNALGERIDRRSDDRDCNCDGYRHINDGKAISSYMLKHL